MTRDGVARAERRDRRKRRRMPVHGGSVQHIVASVAKRARQQPKGQKHGR